MRRSAERGFTLIELLIAVSLTGVVASALAAAAIAVFSNTDATVGRLTGSHNAQLAASYFAEDVASSGVWTAVGTLNPLPAQSVETGAAANAGLYPCGGTGAPTALLRLAWDEYRDPVTRVVVAYAVSTVDGSRQLIRLECRGGTAPTKQTVIARDLAPGGPTVTCRDLGGATTGCTSAAGPARIDLVVRIADPADPAPFSITLTGQRRQS